LSDKQFDPQITLRYRLNSDTSFFARWAEAFKAGGWDTAVSTIPEPEGYFYKPEFAETFEVGVKGNFWDGRARYDATVFETTVTDLQLETKTLDPENEHVVVNAPGQRVRGIEFGVEAALTERWMVGLSGQFMDAQMTSYAVAGCTQAEFLVADTGPCRTLEESLAVVGTDDLLGTIDRSGETSPFSPEWKFVFNVSYTMPVLDKYDVGLEANSFISDGYFTDPRGFSKVVMYDTHGDINLRLTFGDQEDTWHVAAYARSILEAKAEYQPENNVVPDGVLQIGRSRNDYMSYGMNLRYDFQ